MRANPFTPMGTLSYLVSILSLYLSLLYWEAMHLISDSASLSELCIHSRE